MTRLVLAGLLVASIGWCRGAGRPGRTAPVFFAVRRYEEMFGLPVGHLSATIDVLNRYARPGDRAAAGRLLEGRTRVGVLRGRLRGKLHVVPDHQAWVGRPREHITPQWLRSGLRPFSRKSSG